MSQNVKTVRGLYEAFDRGDMETFEKGMSPNLLWNEADNSLYSAGSPFRNFAEIRDRAFAPIDRDFDNFRLEIDRMLDASNDHVVCTGRYRGRYRETGRELSAQFCHVMHVDKSGKLDLFQEYVDTLEEARVAGRVETAEKLEIRQPMPA